MDAAADQSFADAMPDPIDAAVDVGSELPDLSAGDLSVGDAASLGDMDAIDAALIDAAPLDLAVADMDVDMAPAVDMAPPGPVPERLLISEIDYDQPGNDLADFVELYNPAATPAVLDNVVVEFINGDPLEVYLAVPLDGVLASGARLVLGQAAIVDTLPPGVRGVRIAGIQNGAPDAIRLMTPGGPLDGVAYEGNLPGFGEGAGPIVADQGLDAGGSLARCPDDADTGDNATDFSLLATPTPGAPNACP